MEKKQQQLSSMPDIEHYLWLKYKMKVLVKWE